MRDVEVACATGTGIPHTVTLLVLVEPAAVVANPWPESVTEAPPPGPTLMLDGEVTERATETWAGGREVRSGQVRSGQLSSDEVI